MWVERDWGDGGMRRLADRFLHMCVDPAGEDLLEGDFLAICAFSAIGLVLSFRSCSTSCRR